jgi:hypothetical protein
VIAFNWLVAQLAAAHHSPAMQRARRLSRNSYRRRAGIPLNAALIKGRRAKPKHDDLYK